MLKRLVDKSFPLAVYGTLRSIPDDQGNSSLMNIRTPIRRYKCFIPHFVPNGIWLDFKKNACGIAELFFYDQKDWPFVLENIDRLEGFDIKNGSKYGYHRTLVNVKLIPDDYACDLYEKGISFDNRDLKIPRCEWNFPSIAAWVYSNNIANNLCKINLEDSENPIISD